MKYIDVSEHQGVVDWKAVRGNVDGVILRAGYGRGNADKQFARNAAECNRLGIPCGAYWFSYARDEAMARAEAQFLLEAVRPYRMELPLAFDFEYDSVTNAAKRGVTVDKALATAMVYAFCEDVEAAGYWCLNYANPDYLNRYFDDTVPRRFGLWLASWPSGTPDLTRPPRPDCQLWQWTSRGGVPGISGNVDMNEAYTDFRAVIAAAGLNHVAAAGPSGTPAPAGEDAADADGGSPSPAAAAAPSPAGGGKEDAAAKPQAWYAGDMAWMRSQGLVTEDHQPDVAVTWAELATVLQRLCTGREETYDPDYNRPSGLLADD